MKMQWVSCIVLVLGLGTLGVRASHPGHEYHVEGTIKKVRAPHFDVEDKRGVTTFTLVPGTEVFLNNSRAAASDIVVGIRAAVDGVENDRGLVEAKKVKLVR